MSIYGKFGMGTDGRKPDVIAYRLKALNESERLAALGAPKGSRRARPHMDAVAKMGPNAVQAFPYSGDKARDLGAAWSTKYITVDGVQEGRVFRVPNETISEVIIIGLWSRNEGGRAYVVGFNVNHEGETLPLIVDMREECVLFSLLNRQQGKKGTLKGPFVWATFGSQTRLVAVGGELHKGLIGC